MMMLVFVLVLMLMMMVLMMLMFVVLARMFVIFVYHSAFCYFPNAKVPFTACNPVAKAT
jgi:hypothetical protein